jgi:hypothetical protein
VVRIERERLQPLRRGANDFLIGPLAFCHSERSEESLHDDAPAVCFEGERLQPLRRTPEMISSFVRSRFVIPSKARNPYTTMLQWSVLKGSGFSRSAQANDFFLRPLPRAPLKSPPVTMGAHFFEDSLYVS